MKTISRAVRAPRVRSRRTRDPDTARRGVILPLVMILVLVLATAITTFQSRAVIDTMIVRNRDEVAYAEALARSGVHIARAVLHEQLQRKIDVGFQRGDSEEVMGNTFADLSSRVGDYELETPEGAFLRVDIFDNRARLNINSLVRYSTAEKAHGVEGLAAASLLDDLGSDIATEVLSSLTDEQLEQAEQALGESGKNLANKAKKELDKKDEGVPIADAEEFLMDFLARVIENMEGTAAEKDYIIRDLAQNLLDYMDFDDVRIDGGDENIYYQQQDPPYLPANKPMLSVRELGLVEGFDHNLVTAMEPYLTVYPLFAAEGVNLNTAPPHVLGSIWQGSGGSGRRLEEDDVVRIMDAREDGSFICDDVSSNPDRCITLSEVVDSSEVYPPTELPAKSFVYTVISQVVYGDIERTVEAVINMTQTGKSAPFLLYWRLQ
ncbi:MAG: type II secretion system protein GspK [Myxococcota bacterium]|jgi:type II secretory pathway component PulK|nr:type II secretion system protein GspK [Myxococcota bacterium]